MSSGPDASGLASFTRNPTGSPAATLDPPGWAGAHRRVGSAQPGGRLAAPARERNSPYPQG
ncbi:MAG: hypothetical protein JOZ15_13320 [Acidobacteria bacterium]|nr:hypothetical protein [Acidobacteriota bacterium]